MNPLSCKNCLNTLPPESVFCPRCGQKAHTHRLDMAHILHEIVHLVTHADKGVFFLTKEMALKPGIVAKEYVEGKRKKYYNPFSYLVLTVAISAFLTISFNLMATSEAQIINPVTKWVTKNINVIFLVSVPLIALFNWMLFRKDRYNFAEHLSFSAFMGGFRIVFYVCLFMPLVLLFRNHYFEMLGIYMALWVIFCCWAYRQFYSGATWLIILKTIATAILTQITLTVLITIAAWVLMKK